MTESGFTDSLRRKLKKAGIYCLKLNLRFMKGVPDCWYSGDRDDLWNEHKYYPKLPRVIDLCGGRKPKLSVLQQEWLEARYRQGRNVAVVVGSPEGVVVLHNLDWKTPLTREEFIERASPTSQVVDQLTTFLS